LCPISFVDQRFHKVLSLAIIVKEKIKGCPMINKRSNNTGAAGGNGMSRVSAKDVAISLNELMDRENKKNVNERKRLGKFYTTNYYMGQEGTCGSCGSVFRFPRKRLDGRDFTSQDGRAFTSATLITKENPHAGCPCCGIDSRNLSHREVKFEGLTILFLAIAVALDRSESEDWI
jgi:hypothetical protein